jgi:hypothetical protein
MAVKRAFACEAGLSFSTFSVNDSEFHLLFLSMANASNNCPLATGSFETHANALSFFAGSCFSSALARETLSLVVNGGCCVALDSRIIRRP